MGSYSGWRRIRETEDTDAGMFALDRGGRFVAACPGRPPSLRRRRLKADEPRSAGDNASSAQYRADVEKRHNYIHK